MLSPSICRRGSSVSVISWRDRQVIVSATSVLDLTANPSGVYAGTYATLANGLKVSTRCLVSVDPSRN